jgi:hypothetical protein
MTHKLGAFPKGVPLKVHVTLLIGHFIFSTTKNEILPLD